MLRVDQHALGLGQHRGEVDKRGCVDPDGIVVPRSDRTLAHLLEAWGAALMENVQRVLEAARLQLEDIELRIGEVELRRLPFLF